MKRSGPSTEPLGTPQERVENAEMESLIEIAYITNSRRYQNKYSKTNYIIVWNICIYILGNEFFQHW